LIWLVWDVMPPIIMLLFWRAAFTYKTEIAGYTVTSMFVYYLLVMFIRSIVFTHPDETLQREIATGKIASFYLTRPANVLILKFFFELAYKVLRLAFLLPVVIFFLLFYPASLGNLNLLPINILYFFFFIAFTFVLSFLLKLIIGLSAFWFNEIGWLADLADFFVLLFGGTLFPLEFLPKSLYTFSLFLPFRFEVFVPTQIFLGRIKSIDIFGTFMVQLGWIVLFLFLAYWLWKRGIKIYSTYGG